MNRFSHCCCFVLLACGTAAATEDLDAALAALKEKAQRRNYSTRAQLHERELRVPRSPSDREMALDAKLRVMEQRLQSDVSAQPGATRPPARPLRRPEGNRNWLTPALLDDEAALDGFVENKDSWVTHELDRQKEVATLAEEQQLIDRQVNEKLKNRSSSPFSPTDSYNRSLQEIISGRPTDGSQQTSSKKSLTPAGSRRNSSAEKHSFATSLFPVKPSSRTTSRNSVSSKSQFFQVKRSTLKSLDDIHSEWNRKNQPPLTPLKKMRKSSMHDMDPFADDYMPQIKKSIWD